MYKLLRFVVNFKEYITLSVLIVICIALMSVGNPAELRGFRTLVVGTIGVAQNLFSWVPNPVKLKSENEALRELNLYLSREYAKSRRAVVENERLRRALDFKENSEYPVITAEVIGRISSSLNNFITLDVGTNDGISPGMAVITDRGLVGTIITASDNYCQVRLLVDTDSRVAVQVESTRVNGILTWEGGENLLVHKVAKAFDVAAGDRIVTSGFSTKFPEGIVVGRISEVRDDATSLFRTIVVRPFVNFETLEQVFVSTQMPDPERVELRRQLQAELNENH